MEKARGEDWRRLYNHRDVSIEREPGSLQSTRKSDWPVGMNSLHLKC